MAGVWRHVQCVFVCWEYKWSGQISCTHKNRLREGDADLVIQGTCHQFSELKVFPGNVNTLAAVQRVTVSHGTNCLHVSANTQGRNTSYLTSSAKQKLWYRFEFKKYEKSYLGLIVKLTSLKQSPWWRGRIKRIIKKRSRVERCQSSVFLTTLNIHLSKVHCMAKCVYYMLNLSKSTSAMPSHRLHFVCL